MTINLRLALFHEIFLEMGKGPSLEYQTFLSVVLKKNIFGKIRK